MITLIKMRLQRLSFWQESLLTRNLVRLTFLSSRISFEQFLGHLIQALLMHIFALPSQTVEGRLQVQSHHHVPLSTHLVLNFINTVTYLNLN